MNSVYTRVALAVAAVSTIMAVVVASMLVATYIQTNAVDPLENPAIARLRLQLDENPQDEVVREAIREMRLLARKAFFTSQSQVRTGAFLLVGSLAVLILCLNVISVMNRKPPDPRGCPGLDNPFTNAQVARKVTMVATVFIVALMLFTVLFTETQLSDELLSVEEGEGQSRADEAFVQGEKLPSPEDLLRNWTCFRGPNGNAVVKRDSTPTNWNGEPGTNIVWKTAVPVSGFSSPIVWENRVFLSGGDATAVSIMAFDAKRGDLAWKREVRASGAPPAFPEVTDDTGYAAATMVTDGYRVYAVFATGDIAAYTLGGERVWHRHLGTPENIYGHSSSLMLHKGRVLVQFDHGSDTRLIALDCATGATEWDLRRDAEISWASPIIVETEDGADIVLTTCNKVSCHNAETGAQRWEVECMSGEVAPSPAYADGLVFVANDGACIAAIDIEAGRIVWQTDEVDLPDVASPVATKNCVFLATSTALLLCLDAKTGALLWEQEVDEGFYSSPILVGDRIYALDKQGNALVFMAGREYKQISSPHLGETVVATPAFAGDRIYIRGWDNLYCIGSSDEQRR